MILYITIQNEKLMNIKLIMYVSKFLQCCVIFKVYYRYFVFFCKYFFNIDINKISKKY